ncbi:MAG: cell wall hydrolase/autolysin [Herbinix sp.]|jgi:N-acetylmuramoyl-L-alanine amidase|nr:cell wall hydrolase/autolysin [Herbinix sp.]
MRHLLHKGLIFLIILFLITLILPACSKENETKSSDKSDDATNTNVNLNIDTKGQANNIPSTIPGPETNSDTLVTDDSITLMKLDSTTKSKEEDKPYIIAIDAGHQKKGNYDKEPVGPGSKTMKTKVSAGTKGVSSGVYEYELTLKLAKGVKKELIARGYEVVMIRDKHDVDISNKERSEIANESGADILIRIHADGYSDPSVNGVSTLYPSKKNPYVANLSADSYSLSKKIVDSLCKQTKAKNRGTMPHDDMSGINWSEIPVTIIEVGFMTNKKEDKLLQTKDYQSKIIKGICNGIDDYFD